MLFETRPQPRLDEITLSRRVESMPLLDIDGSGPLGDAFLVRGAVDFHDAVRVVRDLPWGHPERPGDPLSVLEDGKGTASDKHLLIAALAAELGNEELEVVFGIYRMSGKSHPYIGQTLADAGFDSLPEPLVWLRWYGGDYDFSSTEIGPRSLTVLQQEVVDLKKMPRYGELRYKDFLLRFLLSAKRRNLPDLKGSLAVREACLDLIIAAEETRRTQATALAEEIRQAEEQARDHAVVAAERAAEEAAKREKELAEADRERKEAYEVEEKKRRSRLLAKARQRAAAAKEDGEEEDDTPAHRRRRKTRKRLGAGFGDDVEAAAEEAEEEEAQPRKRKSTRRAPTERAAAEPEAAEEAEEAEEAAPAPKPRKRKSTRRAPTARAAAAEEPQEETAPEPEPEAAAAPAPKPRKRKSTRKAPTARAAAPDEPAKEAAAKEEPAKEESAKEEPAEAKPAPKAGPRGRKRTRKPPTKR